MDFDFTEDTPVNTDAITGISTNITDNITENIIANTTVISGDNRTMEDFIEVKQISEIAK